MVYILFTSNEVDFIWSENYEWLKKAIQNIGIGIGETT